MNSPENSSAAAAAALTVCTRLVMVVSLVSCFWLFLPVEAVGGVEHAGREIGCGLVPADFENLLPVLRPGAAVVVDVARIAGRQLRRPAVGIAQVAEALDIGVAARRVVHLRLADEPHDVVQRLDE